MACATHCPHVEEWFRRLFNKTVALEEEVKNLRRQVDEMSSSNTADTTTNTETSFLEAFPCMSCEDIHAVGISIQNDPRNELRTSLVSHDYCYTGSHMKMSGVHEWSVRA